MFPALASRLILIAATLMTAVASGHAAAQTIDTYAGGGTATADVTPRRDLRLDTPTAVAGDRAGRIYVAEKARIWRIEGDTATRIAGNGVPGYTGDGGPARDAQLGKVSGLAVGSDGSVYFADTYSFRVRRIAPDGTVTTYAGNGGYPDTGESGVATAIALGDIRGLAIDSQDLLYIATGGFVRRVESGSAGVIAGTRNSCFLREGDPAWNACFAGMLGIGINNGDELHIIEANDTVWRVDHDDRIRYAARNVMADGSLGPVQLMTSVAFDEYNRLYVTSLSSQRVYAFASPVAPLAVAGNGMSGFSGDGGAPTAARLADPGALAVVGHRIYIADTGNHRVRSFALDAQVVPSRPPRPRVEAGQQEVYLWLRPSALPGSSPITGYTVEAHPLNDPASAKGFDADAGTLEMNRIITGLANLEHYWFTVRARNAQGESLPSAYSAQISWGVPTTWLRTTPRDPTIVEGNSGRTTVEFTAAIDRDFPKDVVFRATASGAQRGVDWEMVSPVELRIPAGQREVRFSMDIFGDTEYELDEYVTIRYERVSGPLVYLSEASRIVIDNDDPEPPPPVVANVVPDRYEVLQDSAPTFLTVLGNDTVDSSLMQGPLALVGTVPLGTATVDANGTPGNHADDRIRYTPPAGFTGDDRLRYRICYPEGCREAEVQLAVRPMAAIRLTVDARSGFRDLPLSLPGARTGATFQATELAQTEYVGGSGPYSDYFDPPADRQPRAVRLLVDASSTSPTADFDLVVSVDDDHDFFPDANEVRCHAAMGVQAERCEILAQQPGNAVVTYWIYVQSRDVAPVKVDVFEVPMVAGGADLMATAPSRMAAGGNHKLRIAWQDASAVPGTARAGYLQLREQGQDAGVVPVRLDFVAGAPEPLMLVPGVHRALSLMRSETERSLFIDVPAGASRLSVIVYNGQSLDVYLARGADGNPTSSLVPLSPAISDAVVSDTSFTTNKTLEIGAGQLTAGRWYVILKPRADDSPAQSSVHGVTATIQAAAPQVRPGSYFNAARGGHGLILYPAASQWAGLWYTYLEDGTPTWYYLQAAAPGADGIWKAPIFRSTWLGDRNHMVRVGDATATPTGADRFRFSYTLDGRTGSEPLAALGRGCPALGGAALDASSHWFDPARAGSGYSVQLWPNYEFNATFVYDDKGVARFLSSENNRFGGADTTLVLEQLQGFCPTCAAVAPTRRPVGTFRRVFGGGVLQRVLVDGMFEAPLAGDWTVDDRVQPLGGAGTTQGCQL